jgi:hypothetical protein
VVLRGLKRFCHVALAYAHSLFQADTLYPELWTQQVLMNRYRVGADQLSEVAGIPVTRVLKWATFVSPFLLFWDRALKDNKIGPELFFEVICNTHSLPSPDCAQTWYHLRAGRNNERPAVIQHAEDKIWKAVLDIAGGAEVSPRVGVLLAELQQIDFGEHNEWFSKSAGCSSCDRISCLFIRDRHRRRRAGRSDLHGRRGRRRSMGRPPCINRSGDK